MVIFKAIKTLLKTIRNIAGNDSKVFLFSVFFAFSLVAFKGVSDHRSGFMASIFDHSISETIAYGTTTAVSQDQLMERNTLNEYSFVSQGTPKTYAALSDEFITTDEHTGYDSLEESEQNQVFIYEIQEGDVLSRVAEDFSISLETIVSANNISNVNSVKPGMKLRIPPIDGVIHMVKKGDTVDALAKKYQVDSARIIAYNGLSLSGDLQAGVEILVPDGKSPKKAVPIASNTTKRFALLPRLDATFINPATCIITQLAHGLNGVDCANKIGTPIYAAASGVVNLAKSSGVNSGYGRVVRITHPNGTETVYGHLNEVFVSAGQSVSQGEQIATMGNTGRSTGPHLHFEIRGSYNKLSNYKARQQVVAGQ